jgi:DNA-nicking Smr family endonuclease
MDFGRILDDWEKIERERKDAAPRPARHAPPSSAADKSAPSGGARAALEAWLDKNGTSDKDEDSGDDAARSRQGLETRRLAALRAEATLDLHGLTAEEAESSIAVFLDGSFRAGLEKVLIIHGKGLHSTGSPVLKNAARRAIEAHSKAGRFGMAERNEGGSGALWVLIRKKS